VDFVNSKEPKMKIYYNENEGVALCAHDANRNESSGFKGKFSISKAIKNPSLPPTVWQSFCRAIQNLLGLRVTSEELHKKIKAIGARNASSMYSQF